MPIELIFTNIGYAVSTLTTLVIALIVLFKSNDRGIKITFLLLSLALAAFEISHVLGINAPTALASRTIFWWNLSNIFIICFNIHFIYLAIGIIQKKITELIVFYAAGITLFIFYLLSPDSFLLASVPKLYLPHYYNPGEWYFLLILFLAAGFLVIIYNLIKEYYRTTDTMEQRRIKYYLVGHLFGYGFGLTAHFLSYDINVNPIWSALIGFYTIFFAYAMIKYDLLEIKVVAKRALAYAFFAVVVGIAITLISYSNIWIVEKVPGYPSWLLPLLSSVIAIGIGEFIWVKIQEVDRMKYEFINIVSHKFRTPLTYIRWGLDSGATAKTKEEVQAAFKQIEIANQRLIELTDILVSTANTHDKSYLYNFKKTRLEPIVKNVLNNYSAELKEKGITVGLTIQPNVSDVLVDIRKIEYVIDILIENAIAYNKQHGHIEVYILEHGKNVELQVRDTGMGISRDQLPYVFGTFYRSEGATQADTEGLGLGLYIAKSIVDRHHGEIKVNSDGNGRGSLFTVIFKKKA